MKYTSTILAAAAIANAAPAQPVCNVIVQTVTGSGVWVPNADPTTWAAWSSSSSSSPAVKTSSSVDPTWAAWSSSTSSTPAFKSSTSADPTSWYAWGPSSAPSSSVSATTSISVTSTKSTTTSKVVTTTSKGGEFYPTTSKSATTTSKVETTTTTPVPTTTTAPTTTSSSTTTTTTTTTTEAPKATATCPASAGSAFQASGSCECSYNINCGVKTTPGQGTSFWERHSGELIDTLDQCIAICDENSSCTAVLYVDQEGASAQDYKHCWQTSGLPQPDGTGYAKISYKGACSGSCSASYSAPQ